MTISKIGVHLLTHLLLEDGLVDFSTKSLDLDPLCVK